MKASTAGNGINSTMNPSLKRPIPKVMAPQRSDKVVAISGPVYLSPYLAWTLVIIFPTSILITATGPMETSLLVAKMAYMRRPMNDEYKPYSGLKPASCAYDIPCGTSTIPTVRPATKSL